jgi:hypothetical protein
MPVVAKVLEKLAVRIAYQNRTTHDAFVVNPSAGLLTVSNAGRDSYREFQVTGVYQVRRHTVNASYVRSRAFGDLNDFNQFFPWQVNEDGTEEETLNHVGRHELGEYFNLSLTDDPNLIEFIADDEFVEVTPKSLRLRKKGLQSNIRRKKSQMA